MSVKFLSDEWAHALKAELNESEEFRRAAAGQHATIQQVITGGGADTHYWITIEDGRIDLGVGDVEGEDATITQSYDSAAGLARGELSPVTAFMTGKLKIAGNMGLILGLQGALAQMPAAMAKIDVEYEVSVPPIEKRDCAFASSRPPPSSIEASANARDRPTFTAIPRPRTLPGFAGARKWISRSAVTWRRPGSIAERIDSPHAVSARIDNMPP